MSDQIENLLHELHATLGLRKRPEDVAELVRSLFQASNEHVDTATEAALGKAAQASLRRLWHGYTSMREEFVGPIGAQRQLATAADLFGSVLPVPAEVGDDPVQVEAIVRAAGTEIHKEFGESDLLDDRLNREQRAAAGLGDLSKRQYNKRFRLLRRLEAKIAAIVDGQRKREVAMTGKSGLASRLPYEEFAADMGSAAFIAYLTARTNLRSEFTIDGQQRPYDAVADALFRRLDPQTANWFAIAHVHPVAQVLEHVGDEQRGLLLGRWYSILLDVADQLEELWHAHEPDRTTMIVQRGDDSTTWNQTARAWSKARTNWFALLEAMGAEDVIRRICPGKVLMLVAADVAAWHRHSGRGLHPDTDVWAELPLPWEVLRGEAQCPQWLVEQVCRRHHVEPERGGWTRARRAAQAVPFRATPELVHGVTVADPMLATLLRSAGVFSDKAFRTEPTEMR
jgi:hypothetical protein